MQKIVIVGCGWLGQQLGVVLAEHGYAVYGSRQTAAGLAELPTSIQPLLLQLPLAEPDQALYRLVEGSWLVCAIPPASRLQSAAQYNAQLQSLVELATVAGARGLIHCSSTGVYHGLFGDVDEQSVVLAEGRAGLLLAAEQILQQVPVCVTLRLAGLIGPGRNPARFGQGRSLSGPQLPVNLVHALDISRFVLTLLKAGDTCRSSLYNLCCPEHPLKADFYRDAAVQAGLPVVPFTPANESARWVLSERSQLHTGFRYQFQSPYQALAAC